MSRILNFYCLLISVLCFSQSKGYDSKVSYAIETYAFLKGQNTALEKVSRQFPHLKKNVTIAEKSLQNAFGRVEKNIKQYLEEELNNAELKSLQFEIDSLLNEQFTNPIADEKYAHDFLKKLKERSHNNINSESISKGILSFKYHDAPHQEITDGHFDFFNTEDHPKAERVYLKIPVPKSWLAQEAKMPETIQQFTSYYGNGNERILIVVYDLPKELHNMKLSEESISSILSPQTKLIRTEFVTIDELPAVMIEAEEFIEQQNEIVKIRMLQFMIVQNHKLHCLQGSIGPSDKNEDLGSQIKKYEPLFRLIASRAELDD